MKKIIAFAVIIMLMAAMTLAGGCSGKMNMLMGRWKLATAGDAGGGNQQQYPLPVVVDVYPNGTIDLLESPFGKWTMDRDQFTFKSDDGTIDTSGAFRLDFIEDPNTGGSTPTLTIFMDDAPVSYVLQKIADLGPLESMKRAKANATPAPAPTQ